MRDTLSTVWQPSDGCFDDGVAEKQASAGLPPSKRGSNFNNLMQLHGITEEDLKKICPDCGAKHERNYNLCEKCNEKRKSKRKPRKPKRPESES